ncbi:MAG: hypothetical protein AAGI69_13100 [Cyanobacteria bacterium P01_H01_bin.21]
MNFNQSANAFMSFSRFCKLATAAVVTTLVLSNAAIAETNQPVQTLVSETTASVQAKQNRRSNAEVIRFDVAEDATRFIFDDAPLLSNGFPAYGNSFVTQGYIYPAGTLNGTNGVNPDGSPEFPNLVQGRWVCRGWFINEDGAVATSGEFVITHQLYNFGSELGSETIVSDGWELANVGEPVARAITGGTGRFSKVGGEAVQVFLGFNATEGVNLTFEITVE